MYGKDIKVGMKVVPVIKSQNGPLGKSPLWQGIMADDKKKEKFAYVVKINDQPGKKRTFELAATKSAKSGEAFVAIDLRAYPWEGWRCREEPGRTLTPAYKKEMKAKKAKQAKEAKAKKAKQARAKAERAKLAAAAKKKEATAAKKKKSAAKK